MDNQGIDRIYMIESRKIYDFLKTDGSQKDLDTSTENSWLPQLKSLNRNKKRAFRNSFCSSSGYYDMSKDESDDNYKYIHDSILRRQSRKAEDILSEINRYLSKSSNEKINEDAITHQTFDINNEFDFDFDSDDDDSYIDIFQDDKSFTIREDGWITLSNEEEGPKNNIQCMMKNIRRFYGHNYKD